MDLGQAKLEVVVDASGARSGVETANRAFEQLRRKGEEAAKGILDKFDSAFDKLKDKVFSLQSAFAALGLGLIAKSFIDAGRETENYMVRLQVLLGSVQKGKDLFKEMNDYAARTPFTFREIMGSATTLAGVLKGGNEEIQKTMPLIADLAAASGLAIEDATGQVVKMFSAGANSADMFRERGILAMLGFKQGVSYSVQETRKMLIDAWESPTSKFRDAARLLVTTWEGAVSNLEDAWFQFQQRVMIDGGVLDYFKAVVQVLTDRFNEGFGKASGSAEDWSRETLAYAELVVRGIGAVIEASKFLAVMWEMLKTAGNGIAITWAGIGKEAAEVKASLASMDTQMAKEAYDAAQNSMFSTPEQIAEAKERYREFLVAETKAHQEASAAIDQYTKAYEGNEKQVEAMYEAYRKFEEGLDLDKFLDDVNKKFADNKKASEGSERSLGKFDSGLKEFGKTLGQSQKEIQAHKKAQDDAKKATEQWNEEVDKLIMQYDQTAGAEMKRTNAIRLLMSAVIAGRIPGDQYKKMLAEINKEFEEGTKKGSKYGETVESIKEKHLPGFAAQKTYNEQLAEAKRLFDEGGLTGTEYAAVIAHIKQEYDQSIVSAQNATQSTNLYAEAMKNAAGRIQSSFSDFFYNLFDKGVDSFKDLGKSILDIFKRMLAEMATMALINPIIVPIMNSMGGMMGMGGGQQGGVMNAFTGGSNSGGVLMGGGGGGSSNMFSQYFSSGTSLMGNARNLWYGGGAAGGYGTAGGTLVGAPTSLAGNSYWAANPYGGTVGGLSVAGIGGGIAGAMYGYQQGDGGIGTAGSTAAGAIGGYYAATGLATGYAAFAGGAGLAASGSAALSAIPIVGWIALAALAVDKISGGKIFGSKWKPSQSQATFNFGADGFDASAGVAMWRYQSQGSQWWNRLTSKPWSGGALVPSDWGDKDHKWKDLDVDPEVLAQMQKIFDSVQDTMRSAAERTGKEIVPMIDGMFQEVTTYDKKGRKKETKYFSEFNGVRYEEGFEEFQKRYHAETIIAVLKQSEEMASEIAERWRKDADKLLDGAQMMLDVVEDINAGFNILSSTVGGSEIKDDSLKAIVEMVEAMNREGESLAETYERLLVATKNFNAFLEATGIQLGRTGQDLVEFAQGFVDAAGGQENANALQDSFANYYFTDEERKANRRNQLLLGVQREVGDLGEAGEGLTFENFRERFEDILPKLDPKQLRDWLEAGRALGLLAEQMGTTRLAVTSAADALEAYNGLSQDFNDAWAASHKDPLTMREQLEATGKPTMDAIAMYDGSEEAEARLISAIQERYALEFSYLEMIRNIQESINSSLESSIESIKLDRMSDEEKYEYFRAQANALSDSLLTMTDPEEIQKTVDRINQLQNQAYGLLDEDQRELLSDEFIEFLEGIQAIANERLGTAESQVQDDADKIAAALEEALKRVSDAQQEAANRQIVAADRNIEAANTPRTIDVRIHIRRDDPEVGGFYAA